MIESDEYLEPVHTVRDPAPNDGDLAFFQTQLDDVGGFTGAWHNLRAIWAPNCMVTVEGQPRAQYVYPVHVTTQCKMVTEVLENGDRYHHLLPFDEDKWYDGLDEEAAAAFRARVGGKPFAIRNYIVERAVSAWIIQALVPPRVFNKSRDDSIIDVSNGAYELAHWCTSDGTEFGAYRPIVDSDIDVVKSLWRERETYMKHRHDEDAAPAFWRQQSRLRFKRMKARRDIQLAEQREELTDKAKFLMKQLRGSVDIEERNGAPFRVRGRGENKLHSIARILLPKEHAKA